MAEVLMVIAPEGFRDEEYFFVRDELEKSGHKVSVASTKDVAVSAIEVKEVVVDLLIDESDVADFDALVFVGGPGAAIYFDNEKALEMCYQTIEQGKLLGAICMAPGILARAGVLNGKKATSWNSEKVNLDEAGAITSDGHVVVDGQIVTADGPDAAREFGMKISEILKSDEEEKAVEEKVEIVEEKVESVEGPLDVEEEKKEEPLEEKKEEHYYAPEKKEEDPVVNEKPDEGFPENKPYYGEEEKKFHKWEPSEEKREDTVE
jgi:protease I